MEKEINSCESNLANSGNNQNNDKHNELVELKNNLKLIYDKKYNEDSYGAQVRSRTKWISESHQNPKFFKSLENRHQMNNTIFYLKNENGDIKKDPEDLLQTTKQFYDNLFKSTNINDNSIDDFLSDIQINHKLSDLEADLCEGDLNETEIHSVINKMSKNKTPGPDGLPTEFYQTFFNSVKHLLLNSYNLSFENGELAYSHRQSITSLMFKKNDRADLKNYRPICLSNVDYKIFAFSLANRLHEVLDKLISVEQTAYVKKRFIGQNIRQMEDIIEYTSRMNIPGVILFLDFQKAFDSLEWNFLHKVLKKFGFKNDFQHWIKTIYNNAFTSIKINGFLSENIQISRGIRQGCPLSALLFILCTEILALTIKQNDEIKGIKVINKNKQHIENKLSQYADDLSLFLKNLEQIITALDTIINFGKYSGLCLNLDKTEGLLIGSLADQIVKISGIKFSKIVRYLGIYIGTDLVECNVRNWDNKLQNFQKLLDIWKNKHLTLYSKIDFIKTYALSKIIFSVIMLPLPIGFTKNIEKIIYNFIWGKRDKIRRRSIICSQIKGGLNMLDLESFFESLKGTWLYRIANSPDNWTIIPYFYISKIMPFNCILQMSFRNKKEFPCISNIPIFYQQVILAHCKAKPNIDIISKQHFYDQFIWGNRLFKFNNSCLYSKTMMESNILYVQDILTDDGNFSPNIYYLLTSKLNYFRDMYSVKKCFYEFKYLYNNNIKIIRQNILHSVPINKAKIYYLELKKQKELTPLSLNYWIREFSDFSFELFFRNKLKNMHNIKIKEFLYKLINNICICQQLLFKYKISLTSNCIYCNNQVHNMKHLLWDCKPVNDFWQFLISKTNINITYHNLILGFGKTSYDNALSLIMYIIYKKYVKDINDSKNITNITIFIYHEMQYKLMLYKEKYEMNDELSFLDLLLTAINEFK